MVLKELILISFHFGRFLCREGVVILNEVFERVRHFGGGCGGLERTDV